MKNKEEVKQIVLQLAQAAFDKKGRDIEILDLEGVSMLGDYFLIASANNIKQSQSIADEMEDKAAELGMTVNHREGYREGEWILLDFGDIIVMSLVVMSCENSTVQKNYGMMQFEFHLKEYSMATELLENTIATLKVLRTSDQGAFLDGQTGNTNDDIFAS